MNTLGIKINWLAITFLLVFLVFSNGDRLHATAGSDPLMQLQKSIDEILFILQSDDLKVPDKETERKRLVLDVVNRMFDFRGMARSSLGRNWNDLNGEERDRFVGLFASLIENRYIGKIDTYSDQKVVYRDKRIKGDKAKIYTYLVDKNLEIPIDYTLQRSQGKWFVRDLRIENVSLVANYRRDFNAILRKEKFSGLVKRITEQLEKAEMQN